MARQQAAVLVAGVLVLLALGLPWTTSSLTYLPGWMTPSMCIATADGGIWCSPGYISPGMTLGSAAQSGAGTVARVFLVTALVLMVLARARQETRWLLWAAGGLAAGVLLTGLTMLGGQLAALGASALLCYAALNGRGWTARRTRSPQGRPAPSS